MACSPRATQFLSAATNCPENTLRLPFSISLRMSTSVGLTAPRVVTYGLRDDGANFGANTPVGKLSRHELRQKQPAPVASAKVAGGRS